MSRDVSSSDNWKPYWFDLCQIVKHVWLKTNNHKNKVDTVASRAQDRAIKDDCCKSKENGIYPEDPNKLNR